MKRFLLLLLIPLTANAWTRTSDQQIGARAAQLAPHDLRLLITRLQKQYAAGIDRALAEEGTDIHRVHLRERIEKETNAVIDLIRTKQPMAQVVFRLLPPLRFSLFFFSCPGVPRDLPSFPTRRSFALGWQNLGSHRKLDSDF